MPTLNTTSAGYQDIQAYAGDTFAMQLTFFQNDGVTPINLTGITFKMSIKAALVQGGTALQTFTTPTQIVISGASSNVLTFNAILIVPGGDYYYDLEATNPDTTVVTYMRGAFSIDQDITNSNIEG